MQENEKPNRYINSAGWETYGKPVDMGKRGGYTNLPNILLQKWMKELSPSAYKVLMAIAGATFCFHQDARQLSARYLGRLVNKKSKTTVTKAIQEAMQKGFLARRLINPNKPSLGFEYGLAITRMDLDLVPSISGITEPYTTNDKEKPYVRSNNAGWETYGIPVALEVHEGYTKMPNVLLQKWMKELSPSAYKVLMAIAGKTFCYHKDAKLLSARYLGILANIKSKTTVTKAIQEAMQKGFLARRLINPNKPPMGFEYGLAITRMDVDLFPSSSGITEPYIIEGKVGLDVSEIDNSDDNDHSDPDSITDHPEDNAADVPDEEVVQNLDKGGGPKNGTEVDQNLTRGVDQTLVQIKLKKDLKHSSCKPPEIAGGSRPQEFEKQEFVYEDRDLEQQEEVSNMKRQKSSIPETDFQKYILDICQRDYFKKGEKSRVKIIEKAVELSVFDFPHAQFPKEWVEYCTNWAVKLNKDKKYPIMPFGNLLKYIENQEKKNGFLLELLSKEKTKPERIMSAEEQIELLYGKQ